MAKSKKNRHLGGNVPVFAYFGPENPLLPVYSRHEFLIKGKNDKNSFILWKSINVQAKNQKKLSLRG